MPVTLSVIVPVHNAAEHLRACLEHLRRSTEQPFECIVVDDSSSDASASIAREFGATVLSTGARSGPAIARNLGAKAARADILFFLDADVCVYPDTHARIAAAFEQDRDLDALIGSYDDSPQSKDFLSQYKNLMHCFVHQTGREEASTFWSGCGAIRKSVFLEHSGFNEAYGRPAIEDIELGYRLRAAGRKLVLDRDLQVKHLKRWTFWGLVKTDILDRGIPWTELILRDRRMPNDLNLQLSQRISVALVFLLLGIAAVTAIYWRGYFLAPLFALLFFLLARYWMEAASPSESKAATLWMALPIGAILWLAYRHHMLGLMPPVVFGYLLLFLRHRYSYGRNRPYVGLFLGVFVALTILFILSYLPGHFLIFSFLLVLMLIVVINNQFYLFLAEKRGRLFALAAIPFHLLYHFYNGISFAAGLMRFGWRTLTTRKSTLQLRSGDEQR